MPFDYPGIDDWRGKAMDMPPFGFPDDPTPRADRFLALLDEIQQQRMEPNEPQGYLDRLALSLQADPIQPQGRPGTPLAAFLTGLIPSATSGFAQNRIRSRGLGPPDLSGRLDMLKLAGQGAQMEGEQNKYRLNRAVQLATMGKAKAPPAQPAPVRLGEGDVLVDPKTGKRIATGPPKTFAPKTPTTPPNADYGIEKASRTIDAIDAVVPKIGTFEAGGIGAIMGAIPGSSAHDVRAAIDAIEANIAFGELQEMRQASKTGGALGAISERELELLSAVRGSLRQSQTPQQLVSNLKLIRESFRRWKEAVEAAKAEDAAPAEAGSGGAVVRWGRDANGRPVRLQ